MCTARGGGLLIYMCCIPGGLQDLLLGVMVSGHQGGCCLECKEFNVSTRALRVLVCLG